MEHALCQLPEAIGHFVDHIEILKFFFRKKNRIFIYTDPSQPIDYTTNWGYIEKPDRSSEQSANQRSVETVGSADSAKGQEYEG